MRYNIHGYMQQKAIEFGLSNDELLILRHFEDFATSGKMDSFYEDGYMYYWINYDNQAIIDLQGNVIIPEGMFEKIWNLNAKYDSIVCEKGGVRYTITFEMLRHLQQEYLTTGQIKTSVEEIMEYQEYLQRDFSNGWETIQIDTNNL